MVRSGSDVRGNGRQAGLDVGVGYAGQDAADAAGGVQRYQTLLGRAVPGELRIDGASSMRWWSSASTPRSTRSSPRGAMLGQTQAFMAASTSSGLANSSWRARTAKSRLRSEGGVGMGY